MLIPFFYILNLLLMLPGLSGVRQDCGEGRFSIALFQALLGVSLLAGLIGLGPEFYGGQYGYDDFDFLTVLGSQTASALLTVRMAERLAHAREQQVWGGGSVSAGNTPAGGVRFEIRLPLARGRKI